MRETRDFGVVEGIIFLSSDMLGVKVFPMISLGQSSQYLQYEPSGFVTDSTSMRPALPTNHTLRRWCRSTA